MYAMTSTRMLATFSVAVALCLSVPQLAAQRMRAGGGAPRMASTGYYQGPRGGQRMPAQRAPAPQPQRAPAPQQRYPGEPNRNPNQGMPPGANRNPNQGMGPGANRQGGAKGEHLAEWMNAHRNLSPAQQQQALQNEPGFRELPPQTQQRYRERLAQLNAMDPARRAEILKLNEHMEGLSVDQRGQVRGAMQQLGALPPDQRHVVARSFNELRHMPPDQRGAAMSRIPLNDAQRSALNNLMTVEPMLPQEPH